MSDETQPGTRLLIEEGRRKLTDRAALADG
jgi:hypothetical protein